MSESLRALERGDVAPALSLRGEPLPAPWRALLEVALAEAGAPPAAASPTDLRLADPGAASAEAADAAVAALADWPTLAAELAHRLARGRAVGLGAGLDALRGRARRFAEAAPGARARAALIDGWAAVAAGRALPPELGPAAQRSGEAALVVEATALRALAALESRASRAEGLKRARRASMMARTESLPLAEHLAGLVLARARRLTGRPHLALWILRALAPVVTPRHRAWLAWERTFAGGPPEGPAGALVEALRGGAPAALRPLASGSERAAFAVADRRALLRCAAAEGATGAGVEDAAREAERGDSREALEQDPETEAFLHGPLPAPPRGLGAVALPADAAPGEPAAHVWARPRAPGRRVLAAVAEAMPAAGRVAVRPGTRARPEALGAALALAGPQGLDEAALFGTVWGFAYAPELHRAVLDNALHRLRGALGDAGEVRRDGARVVLRHRGLVIAEPASARPVDHHVLAHLGHVGADSARATADALGMPLRTVQHALKRLAEDGACDVAREGRRVFYRLEDTVFREPTREVDLRG